MKIEVLDGYAKGMQKMQLCSMQHLILLEYVINLWNLICFFNFPMGVKT